MKLERKLILRRTLATAFTGFVISFIGITVAYLLLPSGVFNLSAIAHCGPSGEEFARRWDGSCSGWGPKKSLSYISGSLLHWYSYVTIAVMVWTRHPIMRGEWSSQMSVYLTGAFVFGCGLTHLVDAYTVLHPLYNFQILFLLVNGVVSVVAMFFVIYGLIRSTIVAAMMREQMEKMRQ